MLSKKIVVRYRAFHGQIIAQVSKYGLETATLCLLGNLEHIHGRRPVSQFPVANTSREHCAEPR